MKKEKLQDLVTGNPAKEMAVLQGKIPPNSVEFEMLVLGTCLVDKLGLERCLFIFDQNAQIFYDPKHVAIWELLWDMASRKLPIDMATVIMEAKRKDKLLSMGGDLYLIDLTMGVSSSAHIEYHARVIMEKYFARTLQYHSMAAIGNLYKDSSDVFEQVDSMRTALNEIEDMISAQKPSITAKDAQKEMMEFYAKKSKPLMPCDFEDLKENFNGAEEGDFIIMAARPSIGKTAVALNFAYRTAAQGVPVGVFCLEMSTRQNQMRLAANVCDVSFHRLNRKILLDAELQRLYGVEGGQIESLPIHYDESRNLFKILSKIRILAKKGVKVFFLDYLQIITTEGMKFGIREQELAFISRSLKSIALELRIVIFALAQCSREVEKRASKRPMISDLRESGAFEQDADIIIFLHRPEFYGIKIWDRSWGGAVDLPTAGEIEMIFAKYRNGSPFEQRLRFWGDKMRIADLNTEALYNNSNRTYNSEDLSNDLKTGDDDEDGDFAY